MEEYLRRHRILRLRSTVPLLAEAPFYAAPESLSPEGIWSSVRRKKGYGIAPVYAACGITGDASPSEADMRLTRRLAEGARLLQINLLDHVIVGQPFDGRPGYFSFKEAGTI